MSAGKFTVRLNTTATKMLSVLYARNTSKFRKAVLSIEQDISDPTKVKRIEGYDDVFVANGHGLNVVFQRDADSATVTAVALAG